MNDHKIVFIGPSFQQNSAAINCISDIDPFPVGQGERSDATNAGVFKLAKGQQVRLLSATDRSTEFFEGILGLILLLDNTRPAPLADAESYLHQFKDLISATAIVVGVAHLDNAVKPMLNDYHTILKELGFSVPVFEVESGDRGDMVMLLQALLYTLDPGIPD